jgi:hypothetical protein
MITTPANTKGSQLAKTYCIISYHIISYHIISYHIYSPSVDLYRYGMCHTVYISMQGICQHTIIHNITVQFVTDT